VLAVAVGIVALAALALGRGPARRQPAPPHARAATAPRSGATPPSHAVPDPAEIRDVFHLDGESPRPAEGIAGPVAAQAEDAVTPPEPAGTRLVGLVTRGGRMLAALSAEGEVVLAGPGEAAAGVTVLAVDVDGVRIRRADGSEETLVLP
jgi:hypothetical protein